MNTQRFWMIFGEGKSAPTMKHFTPADADTEAERLARANPGSVFYILEARVAKVKRDVDTIELEDDYDLDEFFEDFSDDPF